MHYLETGRDMKDPGIDRLCGSDAVIDTGPLEILVVQRRINEYRPRGDGHQHIAEIKWHAFGRFSVDGGDARHIACVAPPGQIAAVILAKGGKPATGHNCGDPRLEGG